MRIVCLVLVFAAFLPARAEDWDFKSTQGLIVGVLSWKDTALSPFSDRLRKDRELHELLVKRGVPRNRLLLLLDREATKARIEQSLKEAVAGAAADSTFFFYYAGHGLKEGNTAYLANYDIDAESPAKSGVSIRSIARILAEHFKGKRVVFSGDFCYSGAFEEALQILGARGKQGMLLTSSSASNQSTENWTFSQTWIDCLAGNPLCDRNADGKITIAEANLEIAEAMKARERQRHGFKISGLSNEIVLSRASGQRPPNAGEYVAAPFRRQILPARVLRRDGPRLLCEFYFYSEKKTSWLESSRVKPLGFRTFAPGSQVQVIWNGRPYPARVLKQEDGFHWITYTGYDSSWDEWVMEDRIRAQ
jgi:hypothetical protein